MNFWGELAIAQNQLQAIRVSTMYGACTSCRDEQDPIRSMTGLLQLAWIHRTELSA